MTGRQACRLRRRQRETNAFAGLRSDCLGVAGRLGRGKECWHHEEVLVDLTRKSSGCQEQRMYFIRLGGHGNRGEAVIDGRYLIISHQYKTSAGTYTTQYAGRRIRAISRIYRSKMGIIPIK